MLLPSTIFARSRFPRSIRVSSVANISLLVSRFPNSSPWPQNRPTNQMSHRETFDNLLSLNDVVEPCPAKVPPGHLSKPQRVGTSVDTEPPKTKAP